MPLGALGARAAPQAGSALICVAMRVNPGDPHVHAAAAAFFAHALRFHGQQLVPDLVELHLLPLLDATIDAFPSHAALLEGCCKLFAQLSRLAAEPGAIISEQVALERVGVALRAMDSFPTAGTLQEAASAYLAAVVAHGEAATVAD